MSRDRAGSPALRLDRRGRELAARNRHEEALPFFRRALAADKTLPDVHVHLGNSLLALNRHVDARRSFEAALSLMPQCVGAHNGLGIVESRAGNLRSALLHFSQVLLHQPGLAEAEHNLGYTLAELGDLEIAAHHFRRAITLDSRNPRHYRMLYKVQPEAVEPSDVEALERLAEQRQALTPALRIELHFVLGAILIDAGRFDEAFAHFKAGNEEKRRGIVYDEAIELESMRRFRQAFVPEFVERLRGAGDPSEQPIFVFGMPRSGTTLVEQILAAHPSVAGAGEIQVFDELVRANPPISSTAPADETRPILAELGRQYVAETTRLADGRPHVVDKTPLNFLYAPLLSLSLPNARMIHVRRDAIDTCWSCYTTLFSDNLPFTYDLAELGRYYREYEKLMEAWRRVLPPDRFLEVRYEDVVNDLEAQARRIVEFSGLAWSPECLDFHKTKRVVQTASLAQVRRPLYGTSVGRANRFRNHLDELVAALEI